MIGAELIDCSNGLFDASYYRNLYGISGSDSEAYAHYKNIGCRRNWSPSPHFSPGWFSRRYPNAAGKNFLDYFVENNGVFPNHYWEEAGWSLDTYRRVTDRLDIPRPLIIVGLFGTGRTYFSELILGNPQIAPIYQEGLASCGYFAEHILISSGHATIKHSSSFQMLPQDTEKRLVEPLHQGYHDILFVLRHPFDSLFSNWAWWRKYSETGVPHKDAVGGVFGGNSGLVQDIRRNRDAFIAFMTQGRVPFSSKVNSTNDHFLSFDAMLDESLLWSVVDNIKSIRFEQLHQDLAVASAVIGPMIFGSTRSEFILTPPKSKPFNFRSVFRECPDIEFLVKSHCTPESVDKMNALGYSLA